MSYTYTREATWPLAVFTAPHILTQASHILGSLSLFSMENTSYWDLVQYFTDPLRPCEQPTSHSDQFTFFTQYSDGNHGA